MVQSSRSRRSWIKSALKKHLWVNFLHRRVFHCYCDMGVGKQETQLTFPIVKSPLSKNVTIPRDVKSSPKLVRPMPISATRVGKLDLLESSGNTEVPREGVTKTQRRGKGTASGEACDACRIERGQRAQSWIECIDWTDSYFASRPSPGQGDGPCSVSLTRTRKPEPRAVSRVMSHLRW